MLPGQIQTIISSSVITGQIQSQVQSQVQSEVTTQINNTLPGRIDAAIDDALGDLDLDIDVNASVAEYLDSTSGTQKISTKVTEVLPNALNTETVKNTLKIQMYENMESGLVHDKVVSVVSNSISSGNLESTINSKISGVLNNNTEIKSVISGIVENTLTSDDGVSAIIKGTVETELAAIIENDDILIPSKVVDTIENNAEAQTAITNIINEVVPDLNIGHTDEQISGIASGVLTTAINTDNSSLINKINDKALNVIKTNTTARTAISGIASGAALNVIQTNTTARNTISGLATTAALTAIQNDTTARAEIVEVISGNIGEILATDEGKTAVQTAATLTSTTKTVATTSFTIDYNEYQIYNLTPAASITSLTLTATNIPLNETALVSINNTAICTVIYGGANIIESEGQYVVFFGNFNGTIQMIGEAIECK